ncbi:FecCD family ABC transporter permease [Helicobacter pylori]|uniref:Iron chelate uptake ABC transporter, FeCT family, permease protein n=1 Tax=Helicobacter pylori GAM120Ai TaxID=1159029 RepID=A0AAV3IEU7_HELPX|nr:iron ABC transporter permease [Helicobacter pylori]EMG91889.1 iron chelate uptake ABC transporter, FeCT family, permease protein [Helicobacter pylori GAM118Bi]EMG95605.1 iron chelate uptake ABC transporter, FeCT family, permease protein [Helicobacter pylori GAM120Ai]EMH25498.1 iron chelate uptake ABC transporter, FeCT family, permease protein [Helicobacter pylori GAM264Ai]NHB24566.1 iron ABC transporter permease [Helicobacter pylori]NHB42073.1 iron ABC transporter permease [Helicobacter pyl
MLKTYHIALACVMLAVVVLLFGGESLSLEEWQEVYLNVKNHFLHNEELSSLSVIILEIRLPRVILALLVGASLSGSGVVMQTIFRNPLVDPFLLGISSGAMLGVAMAIAVVESNIAILAFFGAILASLAVLAMNRVLGNSVLSLVLSGVVLSAFLSALAGAIKFFVIPQKAQAIVVWLLGSLSLSSYKDCLIAFIGLSLGFIPLFLLRWRINLLSLSDAQSLSLGINPVLLRSLCLVCVSVASALAVSVSGTIGWIGLVIPHVARLFFGANLQKLLLSSLLMGAFFLLLADVVAKTITPYDLPVGIATSVLGAPFFLWLLFRTRGV